MDAASDALPGDVATLKVALLAERARPAVAWAEAAVARARQSDAKTLVARQHVEIEKRQREIYGPRPERTLRLLDQMELQLLGPPCRTRHSSP